MDPSAGRLFDDAMKRIVALEQRVKQLERNAAPTVPIYDSNNWPYNAVEGQIVIAPVGGSGTTVISGDAGSPASGSTAPDTGGAAPGGSGGVVVTPPLTPSATIPVTDPSGWTRIYQEDFLTNVALGSWPKGSGTPTAPPGYSTIHAYPYPWGEPADGGHYDPSVTLSIHDSMLDTYLHSGYVATVEPQTGGQSRMRIQFHASYPVIAGAHISPLLWPISNNWPTDGEIDWPEGNLSIGGHATCFVHHQNGTGPGDQDSWDSGVVLADNTFHTYTFEWNGGTNVTVQRDDTAAHTFTTRIPNTSMDFRYQLVGYPTGAGHCLCDWIVIWN